MMQAGGLFYFASEGLYSGGWALESDAVPPGMVRRQLVDEKLHFDQTLYWSKEHKLSPAAERFLEFFRKRI